MRTLNFTLKCEHIQWVYAEYEWEGDRLCPAPSRSKMAGMQRRFDAFEEQHLVPSLESLIESTPENRRKAAVKQWVSEYGFLTIDSLSWKKTEPLEGFWNEAQRFITLRQLYMHLQGRRLDILRQVVAVKPYPNRRICYFEPMPPYADMVPVHTLSLGEPAEIEKNPLKYYQVAIFRFISYAIEERLEFTISGGAISRAGAREGLKIAPQLECTTLLGALYLQLYMQMSDEKKICPSCKRVFDGRKADALYCSDKCKQREKMRRYRAKKQKKRRVTNG